jgi:LPXTG-site transpeptidase (sortase) family protein
MQVLRTTVTKPRRSTRDHARLILKAGSWRPHQAPTKGKVLATPRQIAAYVLIFAGAVLCTGVAGTYSWMYFRQRALLKQWNNGVAAQQSLTKLSIPRIHLEDVVIEGVDAHSLLLGPGHMEQSPEPGMPGNAVIAGHRDSFFRRVHSLRPGDDIYIVRAGKRFHYIVTTRKIVRPEDLSVLKSSNDTELTLITCYPTHAIGPAPERLIVVSRLVPPRT